VNSIDIVVIGAGIAGLSAAAALARHGRVAVLEAEAALGYHSSGRSATFCHYGIGDATVRGLTTYSRGFFQDPPSDCAPSPLSRRASALFVATAGMLDDLERLHGDMARFAPGLEWVGESDMRQLFPILKVGEDAVLRGVLDPDGLRLDADALLQSYARQVRAAGGVVQLGQRIASIRRDGAGWRVVGEAGQAWTAPVLVNAAGAWADGIAVMAGLRPLGLQPKRRTIIMLDAPAGADARDWPFLKTAVDDFYMLPESGRLIASPVDEIASDPGDAQPEEYDIALAAAKVEEYTDLPVRRIGRSWAGLRSFVADRVPVAGFAPDAPGFFWLAGQGGYGLQTAPAMASIVEALVTGGSWPIGLAELGVGAEKILPDRLAVQQNESASVRQA
jgi:D-arginine dehydrogenase